MSHERLERSGLLETCVGVWKYVCMREREREIVCVYERERERERERESDQACVCLCVRASVLV